VQGSDGNVGIGTSAPSVKLEVNDPSVAFGTTGSIKINGQQTNQTAGSEIASVIFGSGASSGSAGSKIATVKGSNNQSDSLAFYTGTTTLAERMRITSAGLVGIGTSSPDANLTVNGAASFAAGTALLPSIARSSDLNPGMWFPAADTIAASTAGSERLRIDSSGNLGIGTSTPTSPVGFTHQRTLLQIRNATSGSGQLIAGASGLIDYNNGTLTNFKIRNIYGATNDGAELSLDSGFITFSTGTSFTERLRITSAGNVGINESAPDYKLDVNGTFGFSPGASVTPADNGDVVFELTNNTTLTVKAKGSDGVVRSGTILLV
jgi:hypothetical protein